MTEGTMGLSAADVAAVTRNDGYDGFGNGAWIWVILLAFLFRGNWGGNYGAENPLVSEEFIKRDIFNTNQNVSNTACQTQRDVLDNRYTNQLCCCETQKEILQSRYDAALQAQTLQAQLANCCCELKTAIHAEGEATRGLIQANTIQDLRDRLAERDRDLSTANFQLSQQAQSANIISTLQPTPKPAYLTSSPYFAYNYGGCSCNNTCNC